MLNPALFPPHHALAVDLSPCIEQSPGCVSHLQAPTPGLLPWRSCACTLHLNLELGFDLTLHCMTHRESGQAETKAWLTVTQNKVSVALQDSLLCCFSPPSKAILLQNREQDTSSRAKAAKISLLFLFVTWAISRRYIKRRLKETLMTRWGKKQRWYQRPQ